MNAIESSGAGHRPLRVLFLCTGNAARSQIAEALLSAKCHGRFEVASAGVAPAAEVHPLAIAVLRDRQIDWADRRPKGVEALAGQSWDFVITVCDRAREACPSFPGHPIFAHWGIEDPAGVDGEEQRRRAFWHTALVMERRVDLMLAIPMDTLAREAVEQRMRAIGHESADESVAAAAAPDGR